MKAHADERHQEVNFWRRFIIWWEQQYKVPAPRRMYEALAFAERRSTTPDDSDIADCPPFTESDPATGRNPAMHTESFCAMSPNPNDDLDQFQGGDSIELARAQVAALLPRDAKGVLPLCFTIKEQLQNRLRHLNPEMLRIVLREVTLDTQYLKRIETDQWLHALNGEPVEPIQRYRRVFASGVLAMREAWERDKGSS